MITRNEKSSAGSKGEIEIKIYSTEELKEKVPHWDRLSKAEKLLVVDGIDVPSYKYTNTTTDVLTETIVDMLNPGDDSQYEARYLAVGTDGVSGTAQTDTALNNEVDRFSVTSVEDNANDLVVRTFIDSSEANGNTIDEVGLFTQASGGLLLNHSTIASVVKDASKTMTVNVTLTFTVI